MAENEVICVDHILITDAVEHRYELLAVITFPSINRFPYNGFYKVGDKH